jgi:hypothetical protein
MRLSFTAVYIAFISFFVSSSAFAHGVAEGDKQRMVAGGILDYLVLGAKHMVTGYDHLLFLFGVIFFLTKFKDIIKFITAFTLGHSITLIFATFMGITANEYLVDAVIAMTVIYKGFDNIDAFRRYLKINPPNLLALVFIFGLIHGFGLSTRLQQLSLGNESLLAKIISFNIGVELGQIVALTVMVIVLAGWRKSRSFQRFSVASNVGLMLAGFALLIYQVSLYAQDRHEHQHEQEVEHHEEAEHVPHDESVPHTHEEEHAHDESVPHTHEHEAPVATPAEEHGHSHGEGEHTH